MAEQVLLVCGLVATAQITWGAIVPGLPELGEAFGLSSFALGAVVSAFGVGRLLTNIPAGVLADRRGPRALLLGAAAALAVVTALTGLVTSLPVLIGVRVLSGALGGAVVTVGLAMLAARTPQQSRGTVLATAQAVQLAGAALGPVLGGVVLSAWGLRAVFLVSALPVAAWLGWTWLRHDRDYWAPVRSAAVDAAVVPVRLTRQAVLAVVGANVVGFAVFVARFGGEQTLAPLLARGAGLDARGLGLAMAAITVLSLVAMPLTARALDAGLRRRLMVPAMGVGALAIALYPLAQEPWPFAALLIVAGACVTFAGIVPGVVLADVVPAERQGRATGVFRTVGDLGAVVGPLALGWALDTGGSLGAAAVLAGVVALAGVAGLVLVRVSRPA
ncbi:MFS transporter [Actinotalea sp.]|uniref:MFS transporter n=1 Tax=Actinotalea sp. TaxID=1872145 RepID=UPI0035619DB4